MKEKERARGDTLASNKQLICEKIWDKSTKVESDLRKPVEYRTSERPAFRFLQHILNFKDIAYPPAAYDIKFNYTGTIHKIAAEMVPSRSLAACFIMYLYLKL